jgi:hypothetical protein
MLNFRKYFLIYLFFTVIFLVPIIGFFSQNEIDEQENRKLQTLPKLEITDFGGYFLNLSKYLNDHFGFRKELIIFNQNLTKNLSYKATKKVVNGVDDYLFFIQSGAFVSGKCENDKTFQVFKRILQNSKIKTPILIVIIPSKPFILPEKLPSDLKIKFSLKAKMLKELKEIGQNRVLDLQEALIAENKINLIYRKYESHFNDFGAYKSYTEIIDYLNENYAFSLNKSKILTKEKLLKTGDLGNMESAKKDLTEEIIKIGISKKDFAIAKKYQGENFPNLNIPDFKNPNGKKRVIAFHDSFLEHSLGAYLSTSFAQMINFWSLNLENYLEIIEKENADLILIEIVDRHLCASWE